jgi:competence protein ComEC
MAGLAGPVAGALAAQRGHLFPWVPVCLAIGIGTFFALRVEPSVSFLAGAAAVALAALGLQRFGPQAVRPGVVALALVALGFALAGARAHSVAGPVLDFRYYGAIEGRIVGIDRSASDAVRLTLDRVVLERMNPADTPGRVRVSLHGRQGFVDPRPGATVILTGHLSPPGGAVEPGGFDFRRHAWFLRLGAVGYTRTPVLELAAPSGGLHVFTARMWLADRVRAALPGETGAFAAAVTTGDRSAMGQDTLQDLRDTNLAHLLAISGLHMGLLAGFVFGAARVLLVALPFTRHGTAGKKIAALCALAAATGYLALSGGNVATERAYVMAAVALVAILFDRRALSLRSVALAALIVLALRPEALTGPGFQMSFAATTALVATFEQVSRLQRAHPLPRWTAPVLSLVVSSAVAGLATAPVGMAHFNTVAHYGLLANLVCVPVMGVIVVPMAVVAALLMPFGADWIAFMAMGLGLDWILFVARTVADWPGATGPVVAPGPWVLPLVALGGLVLCLWRGPSRLAGLAPVAVAALLWANADRPDVLIADDGALVGVLGPEGRALSREAGAGFVAGVWLENDGDTAGQEAAARRWPDQPRGRVLRHDLGGTELVHLQGSRAAEAFGRCRRGQIVVQDAGEPVVGPCTRLDAAVFARSGAVAIWREPDGLRLVTDRMRSGDRLWHGGSPPTVGLASLLRRLASVGSDQPDKPALNADRTGRQRTGFVGGVGRLEKDDVTLVADAL